LPVYCIAYDGLCLLELTILCKICKAMIYIGLSIPARINHRKLYNIPAIITKPNGCSFCNHFQARANPSAPLTRPIDQPKPTQFSLPPNSVISTPLQLSSAPC